MRAQVGPQPLRGHDRLRHLDLNLLALLTVEEDALAAPEAAVHPRDAIGEQERDGRDEDEEREEEERMSEDEGGGTGG